VRVTSTSVVKGCTPAPKKRDVEVEGELEKRGGEELEVDLEGRDGGYEKRLGKVMRVAMGI